MTLVAAHRGDSSRYRENTIAAIRSALAAGADIVEIDVRLTADGDVALLHDATLERLWGDHRALCEVSSDAVRGFGGGDLLIPFLDEVLPLFDGSDTVLLIDMDSDVPAPAAHRVVARHTGSARIAWCGDIDALRLLRRLDPDAEIWLPWSRSTPPTANDLEELRPAVVNLPHLVVGAALVTAVHRLGACVSCWTVDDAVQARRLRAIGVDSITTNDLTRIRQEVTGELIPLSSADERRRHRLVARELAEWAVDYVRTHAILRVDTKANPADHVTEVDRSIELGVREIIGAQFEDHVFIGEEFGGAEADGAPCWYLDPVDGTANLANGVPWTSFSLALVEDGMPVVAVVADPWRDLVVEAAAGEGAWSAGRRLDLGSAPSSSPASSDPLRGAIVSTELAGHRPWPGLIRLIDELAARFCTTRIMGSGTLTVAGIALGYGTASVIGSFGPVDHLAACLIVREAGGVVLDEDGRDTLFPAQGGVLAARDRASAEALFALWSNATAWASYDPIGV